MSAGRTPDIAGFAINRLLDRGSTSEVYQGHQLAPERPVAIKVVAAPTSGLSARLFQSELLALDRLSHAGIARLLDFGKLDDGRFYLITEFVDGAPLNQYCDEHAVSRDEVLALVTQACEAVHHAHLKGILHRDLKPAHLLVAPGDPVRLRIIDFGCAAHLPAEGGVEPERQWVGTPAYMSPEQRQGIVDARSDVYSLGVILHELLLGELPSSGQDSAPRVSNDRRLRGGLEWVLRKALSIDMEDRYQSAEELGRDLDHIRRRESPDAAPTGLAPDLFRLLRQHRPAVLGTTVALALLAGSLWISQQLYAEVRTAWVEVSEAEEAERQERERLETRRQELTRLSLRRKVEELRAEAASLYPPLSRSEADLEDWLLRAEAVAGARNEQGRLLEELRTRALPYSDEERERDEQDHPLQAKLESHRATLEIHEQEKANTDLSETAQLTRLERHITYHQSVVTDLEQRVQERRTWRFETPEDQWYHDELEALVSALQDLATEGQGLPPARARLRTSIPGVTALLDQIQLWKKDLHEHGRAWDEARARAATDPRYRGISLRPILGLRPVGADPESGLLEFAFLPSGRPPERDPQGRLQLNTETALIFVLVPGTRLWVGTQAEDAKAPNHDPHAFEQDGPVHEVELAPYFLSKYEMTQSQWIYLADGNPSKAQLEDPSGQHELGTSWTHVSLLPVEAVSWPEGKRTLSRWGLSYPTEAQWECAARAGTSTLWWTGSDERSLEGAENLPDRSLQVWVKKRDPEHEGLPHVKWLDDGWGSLAPIAQYRANPFGFHDILGNVVEWCEDPFGSYDSEVINHWGDRDTENHDIRVLRGSSWGEGLPSLLMRRAGYNQFSNRRILGVRPALRPDF